MIRAVYPARAMGAAGWYAWGLAVPTALLWWAGHALLLTDPGRFGTRWWASLALLAGIPVAYALVWTALVAGRPLPAALALGGFALGCCGLVVLAVPVAAATMLLLPPVFLALPFLMSVPVAAILYMALRRRPEWARVHALGALVAGAVLSLSWAWAAQGFGFHNEPALPRVSPPGTDAARVALFAAAFTPHALLAWPHVAHNPHALRRRALILTALTWLGPGLFFGALAWPLDYVRDKAASYAADQARVERYLREESGGGGETP